MVVLVFTLLFSSLVFAPGRGASTGRSGTSSSMASDRGVAESTARTESVTRSAQDMDRENSYGRIDFDSSVTSNSTNLEDAIHIEENSIYVNSIEFPELSASATIYFYDTGFNSDLVVHNNGVQCFECTPVLYGDDDWYLEVDHFSEWSLVESVFTNGTFEGSAIAPDGAVSKNVDAIFILGFGNTSNGDSTNFTDQSSYAVDGSSTAADTVYWNDTTVLPNGFVGGYEFNGSEGISFPAQSHFGSKINQSITVLLWTKNRAYPNQVGTDIVFGYSAGFHVQNFEISHNSAGNSVIRLANGTMGESRNGGGTATNFWTREGTSVNNYSNGTLRMDHMMVDSTSAFNHTKEIDYSTNEFWNFRDQGLCLGAEDPCLQGISAYNGTISRLQMFDRDLSYEEMEQYLMTDVPKVFQTLANYTSQIINSTEYDPEIYSNVWNALNLTVDSGVDHQISDVYTRAASCSVIEFDPWVLATQDPVTKVDYDTAGNTGECFQYKIEFGGDWNYTDSVSAVNVESFKIDIPSVDSLSIEPTPSPVSIDNIRGNATFLLNDTDTGSINFEWFINSVNIFNETVTGLLNGSIAESTLSSAFTSVGDTIYFDATANNTEVQSNAATSSSSVVIANSGFTLDGWSPTWLVVNLTEPQNQDFEIYVTDFDGDVNATWYLNGEEYSTGYTTVFRSLYYTQGTNLLNVTLSDGYTSESVQWEINVVNTDVFEWAAPLMFGLTAILFLFGGLLLFLDKMHMVIRLLSFLMIPFLLDVITAFMIRVAEVSGLDTVTVLFSGLFKGMIAITFFCIAYVIIYFIKLVLEHMAENKEKKDNDLVQ